MRDWQMVVEGLFNVVWFYALMGTPSALKRRRRRFLGAYLSFSQRQTSMFPILNRSKEILCERDKDCGDQRVMSCTSLYPHMHTHIHTYISVQCLSFVLQSCLRVNISDFRHKYIIFVFL